MDERDRQKDSHEVEAAFARYADKLAEHDRILTYMARSTAHDDEIHKPPNGTANGKSRFISVASVLSVSATILFVLLGYIFSSVLGDIKFAKEEVYLGRDRDRELLYKIGEMKGYYEVMRGVDERQTVALEAIEKELKDIRARVK